MMGIPFLMIVVHISKRKSSIICGHRFNISKCVVGETRTEDGVMTRQSFVGIKMAVLEKLRIQFVQRPMQSQNQLPLV